MAGGGLGNIGTAHVTVELDFHKAFEEAKRAGAHIPPVDLRVDVDQQQVTREVDTKVRVAEKTAGKIDAKVDVDQAQANLAVKTALATASLGPNGRFIAKGTVVIPPAGLAAANRSIVSSIGGGFQKASLQGARSLMTGIGGAFRSLNAIAGLSASTLLGAGAAVALIGFQLKAGFHDAQAMEGAMLRLDGVVANFGKKSGLASADIEKLSGSFRDLTSISKVSIIGAETDLLRFGVVTKKNVGPISKIMLDTAVGMRQVNAQGEILPGFAKKFGRALQDPIKGLSLLARAGVPVTASQKKVIKGLVETGHTAEATKKVLELLGTTYKDEATKFAQTTEGQLRLATQSFKTARREIAERVLPQLAPAIKTSADQIAAALDKNKVPIGNFIAGFVKGAGAVLKFIVTNKTFHNVVSGIAKAISGIVMGIGGFARAFAEAFGGGGGAKGVKSFGESFKKLGEQIGIVAKRGLPLFGQILGTLFRLYGKWIKFAKAHPFVLGGIGITITAIKLAWKVFKFVFPAIEAIVRFAVFNIKVRFAILKLAFNVISTVARELWSVYKTVFAAVSAIVIAAVRTVTGNFLLLRLAFAAAKLYVTIWFVAVKAAFTGVVLAVRALWAGVKLYFGFVKIAFSGLVLAARLVWSGIRIAFAGIVSAVSALWSGIRSTFAAIKAGFAGLATSIRGFIGSNALVQKGKDIVSGLLDGLKSKWEAVKKWLSERAAIIKHLKGPISVDRKLLVDEGSAIMQGFDKGLRSRWKGVSHFLSGVGADLKDILLHPTKVKQQLWDALIGNGSLKSLDLSTILGSGSAALASGFLHPTSGWADTLAQVKKIEKVFHVGMTSGLRPGAETASGNVSQHALGQAADFGTSRASNAQLTNLANVMSRIHRVMKQVIWQNRFWSDGKKQGSIGGHLDHVHLGWKPRAAGGQARKGEMYQWNERGRELFMPNQNGYVMNASRTKELVSAIRQIAQKPNVSNSQSANIQVVSNATDPRAVAAMLNANLAGAFSRA